jgi:hypothetical protein
MIMPKPKQLGIELTPERRCPVCGCLFSEGDWEVARVVAQSTEEEYEEGEATLVVHHEDCFVAVLKNHLQGVPLRLKRALVLGIQNGGGI